MEPDEVVLDAAQQAALDEVDERLAPIMEQISELDASIPLAEYAPASMAAQEAARDSLVRQAVAIMDGWFGVTRSSRPTATVGVTGPDDLFEAER
jgi:hypothetical protein